MEEGGTQTYGNGQTEEGGILLEKNHVYSIYDQIAPHFNEMRHKAWPQVKKFLKNLDPGSLVADIGCGNGRYLNINNDVYTVGLDRCTGLLEAAGVQGHTVIKGDNLSIPLRDDAFDAIVSIGVIHHFATIERRVKAVKELARILRLGGKLLIYVWAFEQKHRRFDRQDVLVPWHRSHGVNRRPGLCRGNSGSDREFSSTSSVSEDDSAQSQQPHNQLFSQKNDFLHSTSSDSVFFKTDNDMYSCMSKADPKQRANSVPRTLTNGRRPTCIKDSHLVLECRKLEASLKALLTDLVPSKTYQQGSKKFLSSESLLHPDRIESLASDHIYSVGKQAGVGPCRRLAEVIQTDNLLKSKSNLGEKMCVNDACSSQNRKSRMAKNDVAVKMKCNSRNITSVASLETTFSGIKGSDNPSCQKQTHKHPNSFFQLLKDDFLAFFASHPRNGRLTDKPVLKCDGHCLSCYNELDPVYSNDLGMFAVREFPLSSCPTYRADLTNNIQILDKNLDTSPSHHSTSHQHSKTTMERCNVLCDESEMLQCHNQPFVLDIHENLVGSEFSIGVPDKHDIYLNDDRSLVPSDEATKQDKAGMLSCQEILLDTHERNKMYPCHERVTKKNKNYSNNFENKESANPADIFPVAFPCLNKDIKLKKSNKETIWTKDDLTSISHQSEREMATEIEKCQSSWNSNLKSTGYSVSDSIEAVKFCNQPAINRNTNNIQCPVLDGVTGPENVSPENKSGCVPELCRYYHVFREGELLNLILSHVPCLKIVSCSYDHANWCIVAEKL